MADEYQKPTHGYNSNVHEDECEKQGTEIKDRGMFDFLTKKKESSTEEECKPVEEPHHDYKPEHHHAAKLGQCESEKLKSEPFYPKVDDYEEVKPAEEHHHHKFGHHDEERKPEVEELTNEVEHVYISEPPCEVENKPCEEEEKKPSLLEKLHRSHSNSSSSSSSDEEEEVMEDGVMVKRKKKSLKEKLQEKLHKKEEEKKEHCEDNSVPIEKCDEPAVHHHDTVHAVHEDEKKGLLEKLKEKLPGKKCEDEKEKKAEHAPIVREPVHATTHDHEAVHSTHEGEKKGFMEKLKEKLPEKKCQEEKPVEHAPIHEPVHVSTYESHPQPHHEVKEEKKGFLEKIKDKFSKNDDDCKEKEDKKGTPAASHY